MVGGSNGGHNTKMMVEDYPGQYDGGLAGYGITSHLEWMGSNTRFVRNFDVFASRIADIVAARTADPNWNPATTRSVRRSRRNSFRRCSTCTPCRRMCGECPSTSGVAGLRIPVGAEPAVAARPVRCDPRLCDDSVAKFDRFYDPDGNGVLSLEEIKAWDPNNSPPPVANDLRRFDNTGNLQRPIIIGHGSHDPIVSPGETSPTSSSWRIASGLPAHGICWPCTSSPAWVMAAPSTTPR